LYRGDLNETFCLAIGEAQASGVPAVVQDLGSVVERVIDGVTGSVVKTELEFVNSAIELLNNDRVWRQQHIAALAKQGSWSWSKAAAAFEELII
jgi:glycosyltransferase involved in cell wall biosynthesis